MAVSAFCTALDVLLGAVLSSYLFVLCIYFGGNLCRECGTLHLAFLVGGGGP